MLFARPPHMSALGHSRRSPFHRSARLLQPSSVHATLNQAEHYKILDWKRSLISYVGSAEEEELQKFSRDMAAQVEFTLEFQRTGEKYCNATLAAAQEVFGIPGVSAEVQGSVIKGTAWRCSDLDILVHTPQPATREEQHRLVEELKRQDWFHPEHVRLGKLAIHVKSMHDIDVVCANTTLYGQRPHAPARFLENPVARDAVLALKYLAFMAQTPEKVPSYELELLVLRVQSELMGDLDSGEDSAAARPAAGPMRLLLRTLMAIVDDEPKLRDISGFREIVGGMLRDHSLKVLHIFLMSRVLLPDGWRSGRDISSWLAAMYSVGAIETPAGPAQLWLIDHDIAPPSGDWMYGDPQSKRQAPMYARSATGGPTGLQQPRLNFTQFSALLALMRSPHARYTLLGARPLDPRQESPPAGMPLEALCDPHVASSGEHDLFGAMADAEQFWGLDPEREEGGAGQEEMLKGVLTRLPAFMHLGLHLSRTNVVLQQLHDKALGPWRGKWSESTRPADHVLAKAKWRDAVLVVDQAGTGDFSDLQLALGFCASYAPPTGSGGWTLFLRAGLYEQTTILLMASRRDVHVQLLGETSPHDTTVGKRAKPAVTIRSIPAEHDNTSCLALVGKVSLHVDDIAFVVGKSMPNKTGHCLDIRSPGAMVTAQSCSFFAESMPCILVQGTEGGDARAKVFDCNFERGCGAGVVLSDYSTMLMERCKMQRCTSVAIEIRGIHAEAKIKSCAFDSCSRSAVHLVNGGRLLEMEDCKVSKCGIMVHAGVLIETGRAVLLRCTFERNESKAVMVQSGGIIPSGKRVPLPPLLIMEDCQVMYNQGGVTFGFGNSETMDTLKASGYGTSGSSGALKRNTFQGNVLCGVDVKSVCPGEQVLLEDNVFSDNGIVAIGNKMAIDCLPICKAQVVVRKSKPKEAQLGRSVSVLKREKEEARKLRKRGF